MGRVLGEILALVLAVAFSVAALAPAVRVVAAGMHPTPLDSGFLVLGMVYGMVAPIGYFLAEVWWRRVIALLSTAVAAAALGGAAFLFEIHRPADALAVLGVLLCVGVGGTFIAAVSRRRRQAAVMAVEARSVAVIVEVARADLRGSPEMRQAALLAERLALACAWMAAHEADGVADMASRLDAALAVLQADLAANTVVDSASLASRLVGEIRARLRSPRVAPARVASGGRAFGFSAPLRQPL